MYRNRRRINRDYQRRQARRDETIDTLLGQKPSVSNQNSGHRKAVRVPDDGVELWVYERLATGEVKVADIISRQDIEGELCLREGH